MVDIFKEESLNGLRNTWNVYPSNKLDMTRYVVPVGFLYNPNAKLENLQILEYDPVLCKTCKSVLNPLCPIDFRSKFWECSFCNDRNVFPNNYKDHISETNLPAELIKDFSTIEYKLNKKESNFPSFIFVIDTSVDIEELQELKETIQSTLSTIPPDCYIGVIVFGTMCSILELGFTEYPKLQVFKGDREYKQNEIQELLGLATKNDPRGNTNYTTSQSKKFLMPLKDCEFSLNSYLDDLQPDCFPRLTGERKSNCAGLAIGVAVSLLESLCNGEPGRILTFLGGAPTIGLGKVVGSKLTETIRNYIDFTKNNPNTLHFKSAVDYYDSLAQRVSKNSHVVDVFSCCLNQVGLLEMKCLVEKTGGIMVLTDSFSTMVFKESFRKIFNLDDDGLLKMCFRGRLELFVTPPFKISGALGTLVSLKQGGNMVSDTVIGEGGTRSWLLGGFDENSTYSFILDVDNNNKVNTNNSRRAVVQILTTYIAGDKSTRLRVTTFTRKISSDLEANKLEVAQSFDQEASATLIAKICVERSYKEENMELIRWLDKSLIRLVQKFAEYVKEDHKSFKLSKEFFYFPQFIFYLRKSTILQNSNASPDEITYSKTVLLRETVNNCTIIIQPLLFQYTPDNPEANPVILDVKNMKNDCVLLLDAYFFICVWHGDNVCKWRDDGFHNDPEYENIKQMLEYPQDYAQGLLAQRNPIPRFVSCDSGSGQERLIKFILNANSEASNKTVEEGFISDDVSYKVFMDHLSKKAVQI